MWYSLRPFWHDFLANYWGSAQRDGSHRFSWPGSLFVCSELYGKWRKKLAEKIEFSSAVLRNDVRKLHYWISAVHLPLRTNSAHCLAEIQWSLLNIARLSVCNSRPLSQRSKLLKYPLYIHMYTSSLVKWVCLWFNSFGQNTFGCTILFIVLSRIQIQRNVFVLFPSVLPIVFPEIKHFYLASTLTCNLVSKSLYEWDYI